MKTQLVQFFERSRLIASVLITDTDKIRYIYFRSGRNEACSPFIFYDRAALLPIYQESPALQLGVEVDGFSVRNSLTWPADLWEDSKLTREFPGLVAAAKGLAKNTPNSSYIHTELPDALMDEADHYLRLRDRITEGYTSNGPISAKNLSLFEGKLQDKWNDLKEKLSATPQEPLEYSRIVLKEGIASNNRMLASTGPSKHSISIRNAYYDLFEQGGPYSQMLGDAVITNRAYPTHYGPEICKVSLPSEATRFVLFNSPEGQNLVNNRYAHESFRDIFFAKWAIVAVYTLSKDGRRQTIKNEERGLQAISRTILVNQNNAFREGISDEGETLTHFAIEGSPGTGKTSILLHRLDLICDFSRPRSLKPHKVLLLVPTKSLLEYMKTSTKSEYFSNISGIQVNSFHGFMQDVLKKSDPRLTIDIDHAYFDLIADQSLAASWDAFFKELRQLPEKIVQDELAIKEFLGSLRIDVKNQAETLIKEVLKEKNNIAELREFAANIVHDKTPEAAERILKIILAERILGAVLVDNNADSAAAKAICDLASASKIKSQIPENKFNFNTQEELAEFCTLPAFHGRIMYEAIYNAASMELTLALQSHFRSAYGTAIFNDEVLDSALAISEHLFVGYSGSISAEKIAGLKLMLKEQIRRKHSAAFSNYVMKELLRKFKVSFDGAQSGFERFQVVLDELWEQHFEKKFSVVPAKEHLKWAAFVLSQSIPLNQMSHIAIDEFQITTDKQLQFVKRFADKTAKYSVSGDPFQDPSRENESVRAQLVDYAHGRLIDKQLFSKGFVGGKLSHVMRWSAPVFDFAAAFIKHNKMGVKIENPGKHTQTPVELDREGSVKIINASPETLLETIKKANNTAIITFRGEELQRLTGIPLFTDELYNKEKKIFSPGQCFGQEFVDVIIWHSEEFNIYQLWIALSRCRRSLAVLNENGDSRLPALP